MKRSYSVMLLLLVIGVSGLYGCSKNDNVEKRVSQIDIKDNLVIDIKDGEEKYRYLDKGKFIEANLEGEGNLLAYNDKADISIFTNYNDSEKYLNIISKKGKQEVLLKDRLDFVYLSKDGSYTFYKTCNKDNIVRYNLINNKTQESSVLPEDILISGDLIKFIDDKTLVLYGSDIENKVSGVFIYDIENGTYKLINEIMGKFMSSLEVISDSKILMIEVNQEGSDVYVLDIETNEINNISSNFNYVEDAILYKNKVFISALENSDLNLYFIDLDTNEFKRLTFDFPKSLGRKSRLLADDRKIYFSDITGKVYYYDVEEDSTNLLENQNGIYMILDK
ncbi:MAG: hypothetical protein ACRDCW_09560 [Sarcina sp.]